jgi:putative nucleotidyltransferase with HDIG domain
VVAAFQALVAHTQPEALGEIVELLSGDSFEVHAARSATEALHRVRTTDYGVIISGHKPPDLDGVDLLERTTLYRPDAMRIVMVSGPAEAAALDDRQPSAHTIFRVVGRSVRRGNLASLVAEAVKIQALLREQRELVRRLGLEYDRVQKRQTLLDVVVKERTKELEESYERLKAANRQALFVLAEAIEAKDSYTKGHCGRVAGYALALAQECGFENIETMEFGAFLHDIGKIGVRDNVLLKPGPLDDGEWEHMREHPVIGFEIAKESSMLQPIMPAVRNHHERWDGKGYPDGLAGEQIALSARIVAIADAYDAMATDRPYKVALPLAESETILRRNAGKMFDPDLVEIFCRRHLGALYREDSDNLPLPGLDPADYDEVDLASDRRERAEASAVQEVDGAADEASRPHPLAR